MSVTVKTYISQDGQVVTACGDVSSRYFYETYIAVYRPFDALGSVPDDTGGQTNLEDTIYSLEAYSETVSGAGVGVFPLFEGSGTGTSGSVGTGTLPTVLGDGTADWALFGMADLPALTGDGTTDGYRPAWGEGALPALVGSGAGHVLIESVGLLPPMFGTGYCGATAEANIPAVTGYALDGSFNVTASGAGIIPAATGEAYVCGIDKPLTNGATSAAVVNLLQQGSTPLDDAATAICSGLTSDDAKARAVVRYVANHTTYTSDESAGIGDRWTCALATYQRRYGDCEDGAILEHSLLLAAGVNPNRLRTAFGTVLTSGLVAAGHAWLMYRRQTDEEWIPLDWTQGASAYTGPLANIKRQCDLSDSYTKISYILTDEAFYAVNDFNYIANLTTNRATGDGTIPALACSASSGPHATGAASLVALVGNGQRGAIAGGNLAALAGTGAAQQLGVAWGVASLTALSGGGATGAIGEGSLLTLDGTGQCGFSASGKANFPAIAGDGAASIVLVGRGAANLPTLAGAGVVLAGAASLGSTGMLPALTGTGRAKQGPIGHGVANLPRLAGIGHARIVFAAVAAGELRPLVGQGHADNSAAWTGILTYNPTRWA